MCEATASRGVSSKLTSEGDGRFWSSLSFISSLASPTSVMDKEIPTVLPSRNFNASSDADVLRKAMKGMGTDEAAIIGVLAYRTSAERQIIITKYQETYSRDLVKDLKSELSGKFENVIVALMTPLALFLAKELHSAMAGAGTKESTLIEILCTRDNASIMTIKEAYRKQFGKTLEENIKGDTSGHFCHLLLSICECIRDETPCDPITSKPLAKAIAQSLYKAGEGRMGTDEKEFIRIMSSYSFPLLRLAFEEYSNIKGRCFGDVINKEFSGDMKHGMTALYLSIKNRAEFFAKELRAAMSGMGTKDQAVIRLVVSRSEIDLGNIKQEYLKLYNRSLEDNIKSEISGDYREAILAIVKE